MRRLANVTSSLIGWAHPQNDPESVTTFRYICLSLFIWQRHNGCSHKHNRVVCYQTAHLCGPLTRHVKLRVAHAPEIPGTFSPPPTSMETASQRFRHASRHMRHARAVMHVGIANRRCRGNPGACATRNFTYLARGPMSPLSISTP